MTEQRGSGKPQPPLPPLRPEWASVFTNPYPFNSPEYNTYRDYLNQQKRRR